jgi:hypothetical protein
MMQAYWLTVSILEGLVNTFFAVSLRLVDNGEYFFRDIEALDIGKGF